MKLFSQRRGYKSIRTELQLESMDRELRTRLWNIYHSYILKTLYPTEYDIYAHHLWHSYFKRKISDLNLHNVEAEIEGYFFKCEWNEVYDLMEFTITSIGTSMGNERTVSGFIEACNRVLEEEVAGYRIVSGVVSPITTSSEMDAIEKAITDSPDNATIHLKHAVALLSDKQSPDYRNSVKESISAVEALCTRIVGKPNSTLGDALKAIEKSQNIQVHSALSSGFSKIYGWTSDANGIRHALQDEPNLAFEDALFMLVSCSAFINYLIAKATKAGIKL